MTVVRDQTGPAVDPLPLVATICQKYTVPAFSRVQYHESLVFDTTVGGGFVVPNLIS